MNPLEAYLKDLNSALSKGNATEHILAALGDTFRFITEIDRAIETSGGWPLK